jgi:hypothetical protein
VKVQYGDPFLKLSIKLSELQYNCVLKRPISATTTSSTPLMV